MPWSTTQCGSTDPGPGNILDLKYNFNLGAGDNGNVVGITNDRDGTRSQGFSYDTLNRLTGGWTTSTYATSPSHCWGESFQFDNQTTGGAWGNLTSIGVESSAYNGCVQENLNVSATTSNRISGYCYDAAGNLLQQGTCPAGPPYTYTYNAVNQITLTAGVTYSYDGDGRRVEKSSGTIYWYGPGGNVLEETGPTGAVQNDYIFFGGQRNARRDSSGNIFAYFSDRLGSSRKVEEIASGASTASPSYDADFYPFGRENAFVDSNSPIYKFTGKQRDDESGLDYFGARYYSSNMGRFMSPDPGDASGFANMTDPQSWNGYSYVRNNPLNGTDLTGMILELAGDIQGDEAELCAIAGSCDGLSFSTGDGITVADFHCSPPYCNIEKMTPGQAQILGWVDAPNVFVFQVRSQSYTYANTLENQEVLQQSTTTTVTELAHGTSPASVVYSKEVDNTLRFSTAEGHEGEFISGEQRANSGEPVGFANGSAALRAVGGAAYNAGVASAMPGAMSLFPGQVREDIHQHPYEYLFSLDEVASEFTGLGEGYEGYELAKAGVETGLAAAHLIWRLSH